MRYSGLFVIFCILPPFNLVNAQVVTAQLPHRNSPALEQWICSDFETNDRDASGGD